MCGLAGASWTADGHPLETAELERMIAVLAHRGPDDSGTYFSTPRDGHTGAVRSECSNGPGSSAALGHRRLSIIDLSGGHQPLSNEDGSVWIAFNGEIYNYRELRSRLAAQGHRFRTDCDTEAIVHLYEEDGPDCVRHLRGMFAIAIWDASRQRLFLARDRIGQKPLFYRQETGRLLFASELKALLQLTDAPREPDPRAIDAFLTYQYVPHPDCILRGYHKLPPAHYAVYEDGRLAVRRYWFPPYAFAAESPEASGEGLEDSQSWSAARWRTELRDRLTEAVRIRMRADVPWGAFLSGGIDSTIIAGLMQQLSDRPVHTFSIGFPVKQFDETSYARMAAAHLGTDHHEEIVHPAALDDLPRLIWQYDEPFSDSSAIPTMHLSRMTRRTVTVALSGDAGDELFAGYDRYRAVRLAGIIDRFAGPFKRILGWRLWQKIPSSTEQRSLRRRIKRLLLEMQKPPERRYLRWINIFNRESRRELYTPGFAEQLGETDAEQFLLDAYAACPDRDFVTRTTCADLLTYLPCDILTKVDIASMSSSLECRSPFLDRRVVELAARMPISLKQRLGGGKRILIETFADLLPPEIQHRPKMGFGVPLNHWFRNELKDLLQEALLSSRSLSRGYFEPATVRRLVEGHLSGRWDQSYRLWALLCFEMWQRTFIDHPAVPSSCPDRSLLM